MRRETASVGTACLPARCGVVRRADRLATSEKRLLLSLPMLQLLLLLLLQLQPGPPESCSPLPSLPLPLSPSPFSPSPHLPSPLPSPLSSPLPSPLRQGIGHTQFTALPSEQQVPGMVRHPTPLPDTWTPHPAHRGSGSR